MTIRDAGEKAKAFAEALERQRLEAAARDAREAACPECAELRARVAELEAVIALFRTARPYLVLASYPLVAGCDCPKCQAIRALDALDSKES